jgi:hypothetical protein
MTVFINTCDGAAAGTVVTAANSDAAGDPFNIIVADNVDVTASGNAKVSYSAALAGVGIPVCIALDLTGRAASANATYIRWSDSQSGTRFVSRFPIYLTGTPAAKVAIAQIRAASVMAQLVIDTDLKPMTTHGTTDIAASKPASALSTNTLYWAELAVTKETTAGAGNGVVEIRITNAADTVVVHSHTFSTGTTGAANPTNYRYGLPGGGTTPQNVVYMSDVKAGPLASGWLGPVSNAVPTVTLSPDQNVAAGAGFSVGATANDPDGTIASYLWTYDYPASGGPALTGATTATVSATAGAAGSLYVLRCTVTDNDGATSFDTAEVRVPVAGSVTTRPISANGTGTGSWTRVGGSATDGEALSDASDGTYLESPTVTGSEVTRRVRWQPSNARTSGVMRHRLWTDSGTANGVVRLYEGTTLRQSWNIATQASPAQVLDTTPTQYSFTLSSGTIAAISDWGNLFVELAVTT